MNSTPPDTPTGPRWKNRTSLVTAAAVAGVLIAGTAAVAANIGILDAADESAIGDLAATDELLPTAGADTDTSTTTTMAVTEVTAPPTTIAAPDGGVQQYAIDGVGTVWIATTRSGVAVDHVDALPGWSAALTQTDLRSLQVDLTNGDRTVQFVAALGDDGLVVVDVTEPMVVMDPNAAPAANVSPAPAISQYDDDHEYDDHDDHEYEEHEYEGADDDD